MLHGEVKIGEVFSLWLSNSGYSRLVENHLDDIMCFCFGGIHYYNAIGGMIRIILMWRHISGWVGTGYVHISSAAFEGAAQGTLRGS